jgi:phosphoesterase RecJ-like protein
MTRLKVTSPASPSLDGQLALANKSFASGWRTSGFQETLDKIVDTISFGSRFFLATHKDPDVDGIGSMLALDMALTGKGKETIIFAHEDVPHPLCLLQGAGKIVHTVEGCAGFDAVLVLDCSHIERLGPVFRHVREYKPLINIDHHETNGLFGDLNLIDPTSSSTGELVFKVITEAGLHLDRGVAENIFAAIQADTGSFRYDNTTPKAFRLAAQLLELGVDPWEISMKMTGRYPFSRLKLLEMALGTIEFYHSGRIGVMSITPQMFEKAQAHRIDSERFVDYPRCISGVELAVLIRQVNDKNCKFSLRGNGPINVAKLAVRFGGGGHSKAAAFECQGSPECIKGKFLEEAIRFLDGRSL